MAELYVKTFKSNYHKEENVIGFAGCGNGCVYLADRGAGRYGFSTGDQFYLSAADFIVSSHGDSDRLVWSGLDIPGGKRVGRDHR